MNLGQRFKPGQPARRVVLMLVLGVSIGATAWLASSDDEADAVKAPARRAVAVAAGASTPRAWPAPLNTAGSHDTWAAATPQVRASWGLQPPAPAVAKVPEPSAPVEPPAPPLSYQVVGRMDDSAKPRAIFSSALRTEVLGVGELLDRQWRIDSIEAQGVQLTWLRGGQKKFLAYPTS